MEKACFDNALTCEYIDLASDMYVDLGSTGTAPKAPFPYWGRVGYGDGAGSGKKCSRNVLVEVDTARSCWGRSCRWLGTYRGRPTGKVVVPRSSMLRKEKESDSASIKIPEVDLELASGTLGGMVTTVEGLVTKVGESLERVHGFTFGDSLEEGRKEKWLDFNAKLKKLLCVEEPWTLILDDALANSFIAPSTDDLESDSQLKSEEYERSWEQNEEFGINDMDTSLADAAYHTN